jgi:hypothetical protein
MGGMHHWQAVRLFDRPYTWLLAGTCRQWEVCVEGRAKVNHDLSRVVVRCVSTEFLQQWWGWTSVQGDGRRYCGKQTRLPSYSFS